jgi:hypothetical protein
MKAPLSLTLLCLTISLVCQTRITGQQTSIDNINLQAINQGLFDGTQVTVIEDTFFLFKDNGESFKGFVRIPRDKVCQPSGMVSTLNDAIEAINKTLTLVGIDPVDPLTEAFIGPEIDVKFG